VGSGARAGTGVRVGQGVAVGRNTGVGDGDGPVVLSANALAASRRATRSQATTKLIRLKATIVALNPLPTFACRLRGCGLLVVIVFVILVTTVILVIIVVFLVTSTATAAATAAAIPTAAGGRCRLARGDLVVGDL
jgi:hypothetical protein